jgi:hypothetical protein
LKLKAISRQMTLLRLRMVVPVVLTVVLEWILMPVVA